MDVLRLACTITALAACGSGEPAVDIKFAYDEASCGCPFARVRLAQGSYYFDVDDAVTQALIDTRCGPIVTLQEIAVALDADEPIVLPREPDKMVFFQLQVFRSRITAACLDLPPEEPVMVGNSANFTLGGQDIATTLLVRCDMPLLASDCP